MQKNLKIPCNPIRFDYAQQFSPQHIGPLYFLTPRICQLFGITKGKQVNYLIDESDSVGKGANSTT